MHLKSMVIAALAALTLGAGISTPAFAKFVSISGTHSRDEIKSKCADVGGTYTEPEGGKEYYCGSPNGNGVLCQNDGKCQGIVAVTGPQPQNGESLLDFLKAPTTGLGKSQTPPPPPPVSGGNGANSGVILY